MMDHWNTMSAICWPKFGTNHVKREDPQKDGDGEGFFEKWEWDWAKMFFFVQRQVKIKVFS
jgi:hypothetical protein